MKKKFNYQVNEEEGSSSNYKKNGKWLYREEIEDLREADRRYNYQEDLKNKEYEEEKTLTIWDIPPYVTRTQIFKAVIHMRRVKNIEII